MIERKGDKEVPAKKSVKIVEVKKEEEEYVPEENGFTEDVIAANRRKLAEKLAGKKKGDSK